MDLTLKMKEMVDLSEEEAESLVVWLMREGRQGNEWVVVKGRSVIEN